MKDTTKNKSLTEALISKKPATASKLFKEAMDQRLDELSKKTLGNYISRAVVNRDRHIKDSQSARSGMDALGNISIDNAKESQAKDNFRQILGDKERASREKMHKRERGILHALGKLTKEDLDEVEAPANFWNAGMSRANPIQVSQKQPAEPGQFKATNVKSPTRLADRDSALEGAPRATRQATADEATRRGPRTIELTGDWQADIPDHQFDPKLDSETEYYPLFSQFKALGAYPSGPAMAWEEEQIDEAQDFDPSYREHTVFKKTFGRNHPGEALAHARIHRYTSPNGTQHEVRMESSPDHSSYRAEISSANYGNKRMGSGIAATSHEAFDKAHKAYKENFKMPEYMKEDELNEISKETLGKYINRASHGEVEGKPYKKNNLYGYGEKHAEQAADREKLHNAHNTLSGLNVMDNETSYKLHKANVTLNDREAERGRKEYNRVKGIKNAVGKLTGTAKVPAGEKQRPIEMLKKISEAEDKKKVDSVTEETLDEGLFDPAKHELLGLWDEHARRADAHGSGSRNEILKRIEDHVAKKHGVVGLKKMRLHTDLTNALKHSISGDKGHLQALLGNMRSKCAMEN